MNYERLESVLLLPRGYIQLRMLNLLEHDSIPSPLGALKARYAIACTARTGSTALCDGLDRFGLRAHEYFNSPGFILEARQTYGIRTTGQFGRLLAERFSPGGRFCTKISFPYLAWLFLLNEYPGSLKNWKFVFLTRQDIVRQAVSGYIADFTGSWKQETPPARQISEGDYNFSDIYEIMRAYCHENSCWELFFTLFGIEPLRITYEMLDTQFDTTLESVAAFLGLPLPVSEPNAAERTSRRRQTTYLNHLWAQRVREDARRWA
jgi:trehalose 2-sulfotransferase